MPTLEPESLQIHCLVHISLRDDRDEASNSPPIQRAFAGSVAEEGCRWCTHEPYFVRRMEKELQVREV
jgi:hypothetical protein